MDQDRDLFRPAAVAGVCVMLGLVIGGWVLGSQIKAMKLADRYVTVKGLVERTVKSDSAVWPLTFKSTGNDLGSVFADSENNKKHVVEFLKANGVADSEINFGDIQVTDKLANEYGNQQVTNRYIVQQTVTAGSKNVDKIAKAGTKTAELVQKGVVLVNPRISYKFAGLNDLKPDMITEATRNARQSAQRFAADSGSEVGSIRQANQGVFSISAAQEGTSSGGGGEEGGGYSDQQAADSSIMKKVRVVATIDYYLLK